MLCCPLKYESQSAPRQTALDHFQCSNVDQGFVLAIHGMKMGRRMFPPEHLDHDPEKLANGWHDLSLVVV